MIFPSSISDTPVHKIMQAIKWTVYTLLIVNFGFYVVEDWNRAFHTLRDGATFLEWTSEFATSIDEIGWFLLLAMFELETYVLSDDVLNGWVGHIVRGVRMFCYLMIAHTIYAFAVAVADIRPTVPVEGVTDLCMMTNEEASFVRNLEYTHINEQSCAGLSDDSSFFWVAGDPIVSDTAGLSLERTLVWVDLAEATTWLLVLVAIEMVVRLQSRGITSGTLITFGNGSKVVLYSMILTTGAYWAYLGHWVYLWDEIVWIGGFAAIEMNVAEWRDELLQKNEPIPQQT